MIDWRYRCEVCGHQEPGETREWRCPACGGAFALDGLNRLDPDDIRTDSPTLWRYAAALPVDAWRVKSLGEGMTPLIPGFLAGEEVYFKCDYLLPTGSFKDRGAVVLAAHLLRLGLRRIIVDSSGNAAAAMAGYAAANRITCTVFAPETTSAGKLVQSRAFGAAVELVGGSRDDVARAAQAAAADKTSFYASHNWHAVFVEGVKTWAFETWEQLDRRTPAAVYVPTGGGSAFVGGYRGFAALGGPLPRMIAAQPEACAPLVHAVEQGAGEVRPVIPGRTMAEGARIGAPARGRQMLEAIHASGGAAQAVSDAQIGAALRQLWAQGLYVEPTAAVGAAAFIAAVERGDGPPEGDAVILLTGSGLKATDTISILLD
jgi:threonine synthase